MSSYLPSSSFNITPISANNSYSNTNRYINASQANYGFTPVLQQKLPQMGPGRSNYINSASFMNLAPRQASLINLKSSLSANNYLQSSLSANNLPIELRSNRIIPQQELPLNNDPNPLVVRKRSQPVHYNQNIGVRFIKPEPLPPHGDIVIKHLPDSYLPPPPPHYIRNQPPPPSEQPPRIIREAPPVPPPRLPDEVYTIPGKRIQAPRKIIIENYAEVPIPRPEYRVVYQTPNLLVRPQEAICFNF